MVMILAAISIISIALFITAAKICRTDSEIYCKITSDYRDKFQMRMLRLIPMMNLENWQMFIMRCWKELTC